MSKRAVVATVFVAVFLGLISLLGLGLNRDPNRLDLATKNQHIPTFSLPSLLDNRQLTHADWRHQRPYFLVNFWGSWCAACCQEHAYLLQLSRSETLYGVNWKDDRAAGRRFLQQGGNPFKAVIVDEHSVLAIGMGVYGAPETFLIRADGTILARYAGAMSDAVWQKEFEPIVRGLR